MSSCLSLKDINIHVLVMVCMCFHWLESFPYKQATALAVDKGLLERTIPTWGIPLKLCSENSMHFIGKILNAVCDLAYTTFPLCLLSPIFWSSTLAWKIPWMEEPGRLQPMGSLRVGYDWATSLSLLTFMHWRRKWQPTPVFLSRESQGWGNLMRCRLWGLIESDTTEAT